MQSMLMAAMVAEIAPPLASSAKKIAEGITKNRVIAGVHYPSDGEASELVVDGRKDKMRGLHSLLRGFDDYKTIRNAAYLEINGADYNEEKPQSSLE